MTLALPARAPGTDATRKQNPCQHRSEFNKVTAVVYCSSVYCQRSCATTIYSRRSEPD